MTTLKPIRADDEMPTVPNSIPPRVFGTIIGIGFVLGFVQTVPSSEPGPRRF